MVNFGFFDDWHPQPGRITSWSVSEAARAAMAAAPPYPTPPCYQQEEYLRAAHRQAGTRARTSRVTMISFDMPGEPDVPAMTRALTAFVRRHDTFGSRFEVLPDDRVVRHALPPERIDLVATDHGDFADAAAIRAFVQANTPDARHWDCFGFGVIRHEGSFTVYAAIDHLHTDGVGQAITCVDLLMLYGSELGGTPAPLAAVEGHLGYCDRERAHNEALTEDSPEVRAWVDLLRRNGGDMPSFPLYLGTAGGSAYTRGAQITLPLFDEPDAQRFEEVCEARGGRFVGGLFAALALTELELTGADWYFVLTPVNTRTTAGEANSIGWYTNLVPVAIEAGTDNRFTGLVAAAQRAADSARELGGVSPHRVVELAAQRHGVRTRPGWAAMMMSYIDLRKFPGVEMFDRINGGMFANDDSPGEVYVWVNRFPDVTKLSLLFPDTPEARQAVDQYIKTLLSIVGAVAHDGDYTVGVAV
ncbi:condensation domain-containing protein [Nocardia sp. NPDC004068]|uniref:condensation domain-containing protein n=1 Tax=Nocardia sp. NPDC004068 TaxID=3364303 RepID=UPI0036C5AF39